MCVHEQWWLHRTVSGGCGCLWMSMCTVWLSHSKRLRESSKESASNFVLSLNIPPWKLFRWFRRLQLWATGDWQLHHDNMLSHVSCLMQSFFVKHQITQVTQAPCSPDLVPYDFWLLPKLITFQREEISDHRWDSGKYNGAAYGDWKNCMGSQGAYFEGGWSVIVLCTMFLVSSSINVSIFHNT